MRENEPVLLVLSVCDGEIILEKGEILCEKCHRCWFLDLDVFHKGFACARDHSGWFHIDVNGQSIYSNRFAAIEPFYNGQARVENFDGSLLVINETGENVVKLREALLRTNRRSQVS